MTDQPMAYPLSWPVTWPRTKVRRRNAHFREASVDRETRALRLELERLGASGAVLSTNLTLRRDGLPRSDQRMPADPGVAVYFKLRGQPQVLASDRWDRVEHNIRALALHIEALRGLDRWGVGSIEQAFSGYKALPESTDAVAVSCWTVLGVKPDASEEQIRKAFRDLVPTLHPDRGGSHAAMAELNLARDQALATVASRS